MENILELWLTLTEKIVYMPVIQDLFTCVFFLILVNYTVRIIKNACSH